MTIPASQVTARERRLEQALEVCRKALVAVHYHWAERLEGGDAEWMALHARSAFYESLSVESDGLLAAGGDEQG